MEETTVVEEQKAFSEMSDEEYAEFLKGRDVKTGLEIMESIGYKNVPLGQSTDITPKDSFRELGLACKFEHAIGQLPVIPDELGAFHPGYGLMKCKMFGRVCPGGILQVLQCFGNPQENDKSTGNTTEEIVQEVETPEVVE